MKKMTLGRKNPPLSLYLNDGRTRLVGWLMLFLIAYRGGLPVLYSAALAALPWLLLTPLTENRQ